MSVYESPEVFETLTKEWTQKKTKTSTTSQEQHRRWRQCRIGHTPKPLMPNLTMKSRIGNHPRALLTGFRHELGNRLTSC